MPGYAAIAVSGLAALLQIAAVIFDGAVVDVFDGAVVAV